MPQFVIGPNNPAGIIADPNTGAVYGDVKPSGEGGYTGTTYKPPKKKKKKTTSGGGGGGGAAAAGETAAQRRARLRRERAQRRREAAAARRAERERQKNPLYRPFLTPAELRAEAERLAQLSVASEESLRTEQAAQESGIGALTGTIAGALGGYQQQVAGGLQGLGQMYQNIAGAAQQAGGEALAAAGVAPTDVPSVSPTVASEFANLTAATSGFVPAIQATGQRIIGESRLGLTRALAERANTLSANMARYLRELQQEEYDRALAQEIQSQNVARLGLQEQELAADTAYREANLALSAERNAQGWARIEQQAINAALRAEEKAEKAGRDSKQQRAKKIQTAKDRLLRDRNNILRGDRVFSGLYNYKVTFVEDGVERSVNVKAVSDSDARQKAADSGQIAPSEMGNLFVTRGTQAMDYKAPSANEVINFVTRILVNAGMKREAARRWATNNIARGMNISGAFMGGVGGSSV
jgi:hypothetical protein